MFLKIRLSSPLGLIRIVVVNESKDEKLKNKESGCEARLKQLSHVQQYMVKGWEFDEVGGERNS